MGQSVLLSDIYSFIRINNIRGVAMELWDLRQGSQLRVKDFLSPHRAYQPLPRTIGFGMLAHRAGWPMEWIPVCEWGTWGLGLSHANFTQFHQRFPPKIVKFPASLGCCPGQLVSFWSIHHQNGQPWHWTSVLDIVPKCFNSKFQFKTSQCSIWGEVMPAENVYAKDCTMYLLS